MEEKMTRIVMILMLLLPISSYSKTDTIYEIGLATGIFVSITILVVITYVLSQIVTNKEIENPAVSQRN